VLDQFYAGVVGRPCNLYSIEFGNKLALSKVGYVSKIYKGPFGLILY
jgi:hypothetical protein